MFFVKPIIEFYRLNSASEKKTRKRERLKTFVREREESTIMT